MFVHTRFEHDTCCFDGVRLILEESNKVSKFKLFATLDHFVRLFKEISRACCAFLSSAFVPAPNMLLV